MHSFHGQHLSLEAARLYTLPDSPPPVAVAAGGPAAAALAGEEGDALVAVEPSRELVEAYRQAGGTGPAYGQVALCWGEDEGSARQAAWTAWRFAVPGWKVMAELPGPPNFEAATVTVRESDVAEKVPCGPDPKPHLAAIAAFIDAGFDHVAVVQAGPDQAGFLRFWTEELRPALD
jgi:G6PDH family F420-dependent oxidoreductase